MQTVCTENGQTASKTQTFCSEHVKQALKRKQFAQKIFKLQVKQEQFAQKMVNRHNLRTSIRSLFCKIVFNYQ